MKKLWVLIASLALWVAHAGGEALELRNDYVSVKLDAQNQTWDAVWLNGVDAAIRQAGFAIEVNGKTLRAQQPASTRRDFHDRLGAGQEIVQRWTNVLAVEESWRIYDGGGAVTLSTRLSNPSGSEVSLGTQHVLDLYEASHGSWNVGHAPQAPASVYIAGASELQCLGPGGNERDYTSSGFLELMNHTPRAGLVVGFLTAFEAKPNLSAQFHLPGGGTRLLAHQPFLGRPLGAGESVNLDTLYLAAQADPYRALENYGDAMAAFAAQPVRTKATGLWCSWYAHRMALSEDLVLANAAVAAKHFQPLGLEIMQLDHGWERGDVTGDWVPNERFPHGLAWLARQLQSRYGLKLGVWIAPTDVAETSETGRSHPDWLLKDGHGKPLVNWRWYWKPNPNCYELDASNPAAAKSVEDAFAQLTAWGVKYYKIDFIASSAGEQFVQQDPKTTRGWGVLRQAMQAVRRGAGPEAWIRYCQTPPALSAGLADSVIGGNDTLDAGLNGDIEVLRTSARSLAAGYWLNDRVYHREVCDMSVRMQADLEETRLRLALMTLAGCSISFSDEFQYLPPSRIRLMQACLPPGNPPMKPLDLFERAIPSVWRIHCRNAAEEWDVVGLFNFEKQPEERTIEWSSLGLSDKDQATVFEFWEQRFLGLHQGKLSLTLPAQSSRILCLHRAAPRPQVVGTDMHLLMGYHELERLSWDAASHTLSGECARMPGVSGQLFIYVPEGFAPHFDFPLSTNSAALTHIAGRLWSHEIEFGRAREPWAIPFEVVKEHP